MITGLLKKIFGSRNDRLIKQYSQTVARINALEAAVSGAAAKTDEFRSAMPRARRWTPCCRRPLPWCARPASACSACATSTCS
jgi:preprotein translocase subunit SecA